MLRSVFVSRSLSASGVKRSTSLPLPLPACATAIYLSAAHPTATTATTHTKTIPITLHPLPHTRRFLHSHSYTAHKSGGWTRRRSIHMHNQATVAGLKTRPLPLPLPHSHSRSLTLSHRHTARTHSHLTTSPCNDGRQQRWKAVSRTYSLPPCSSLFMPIPRRFTTSAPHSFSVPRILLFDGPRWGSSSSFGSGGGMGFPNPFGGPGGRPNWLVLLVGVCVVWFVFSTVGWFLWLIGGKWLLLALTCWFGWKMYKRYRTIKAVRDIFTSGPLSAVGDMSRRMSTAMPPSMKDGMQGMQQMMAQAIQMAAQAAVNGKLRGGLVPYVSTKVQRSIIQQVLLHPAVSRILGHTSSGQPLTLLDVGVRQETMNQMIQQSSMATSMSGSSSNFILRIEQRCEIVNAARPSHRGVMTAAYRVRLTEHELAQIQSEMEGMRSTLSSDTPIPPFSTSQLGQLLSIDTLRFSSTSHDSHETIDLTHDTNFLSRRPDTNSSGSQFWKDEDVQEAQWEEIDKKR